MNILLSRVGWLVILVNSAIFTITVLRENTLKSAELIKSLQLAKGFQAFSRSIGVNYIQAVFVHHYIP